MKCPKCSGDMKLGRIYGDRYSLKYLADPKRAVIFAFGADRIGTMSAFQRPNVITHRCPRCAIQIIDEHENDTFISPGNQ
jgi:Domain of unknown function (DUF6487)